MSPGGYLRLRREAAGLSIDEVALAITDRMHWLGFNRACLQLVEAGSHVPTIDWLLRLRRAFDFDPHVVVLLAHALPVDICRGCGCTALDACDDEMLGPCAWATAAHDLCTRCFASAVVAHRVPALPPSFPTGAA